MQVQGAQARGEWHQDYARLLSHAAALSGQTRQTLSPVDVIACRQCYGITPCWPQRAPEAAYNPRGIAIAPVRDGSASTDRSEAPRRPDRGAARFERLPSNLHPRRSEEHTSELPSLMRISYAVFCLTKK